MEWLVTLTDGNSTKIVRVMAESRQDAAFEAEGKYSGWEAVGAVAA